MLILNTREIEFEETFKRLLSFETINEVELVKTVDQIISDVRHGGDECLLKLTQELDQHPAQKFEDLCLDQLVLRAMFDNLEIGVKTALEFSSKRIWNFHKAQVQEGWTFEDEFGNVLGQKITPLDRVGIYVPGGLASYPSSVLMNAIPAKSCGCK